MNLQDRFSHRNPLIEPLEQRIAPALLVSGANLLGAGNPTTGETSIGGNSVTLVKVLSGEAIVWFYHGGISAISVGPNTSLDITGDVGAYNNAGTFIPGPIIGNLTAAGKLSNSGSASAGGLDGDVLLPNNITGITTHPLGPETGTIGNIITGGSVSNLNISGSLSGIFAGTGAFYTGNSNAKLDSHVLSGGYVSAYVGVDTNPVQPLVQSTFYFAASNAKTVESGATISNVKVGLADALQVFAGNGFAGTAGTGGHGGTPGLAGGSISNITIESAYVNPVLVPSDPPCYDLMAGSGGSGAKGGEGGSITNIDEVSSNGVVDILAGAGGAGSSGAGGVGGSIASLNMQSDSSAYTVHAGHGGTGAPGGAGGSVKGVNFGGNQLSNGIILAAPFTGGSVDDILLVDSQTGNMVIEKNDGNGTGFTPVVQDPIVSLETIAPVGTTPVAASVIYLNGSSLPDIVVAYKNSDNLGVYLNQGGGVFYQYDVANYTGDTLEATSISLSYAPSLLAVGNFTGDGSQDIAVAVNVEGKAELMTLTGDGVGGFAVPSVLVPLPYSPVSLIPANISSGNYSDLFVGFKNGQIDSLLTANSVNGLPFNPPVDSGITVPGGLANLDYYPAPGNQPGVLMALSSTGNEISLYASDSSGTLFLVQDVPLTGGPGTALVAHFVPSLTASVDPIEVLSSVGSGSRIDVYTLQNNVYTLTSSTSSTEALKNFIPVIEGNTTGIAAVGSSVEHFAFSQNGGQFYDVQLPFTGKTVSIAAGDGGDGLTTVTAGGGAGGLVSGFSILAGQITVQAGNGGSANDAPAGAGGLISDSPVLATFGGGSVQTILQADTLLSVVAGAGGTATGTGHTASGGAGGLVEGLNLSMLEGNIVVTAGNGGTGDGGAGQRRRPGPDGGNRRIGAGSGRQRRPGRRDREFDLSALPDQPGYRGGILRSARGGRGRELPFRAGWGGRLRGGSEPDASDAL